MSERADRIRSALQQSLSPEKIELGDDSAAHAGHTGAIQSGGGHFSVYIVAEAFEGKSQVRRHQMIYQALGDLMKTDIHALVIKALTPSELP